MRRRRVGARARERRGHRRRVARLHAHVDDRDARRLDRRDGRAERAARDRRAARSGPKPSAPCARPMRGEVDVRIGDALADPLVLDRPVAHARDALLVHLVVVERAVVGDDDAAAESGSARRSTARSRPSGSRRRRRSRPAALPRSLQRQRRADGDAGPAADAAAAVGAEEVERMAERPARAVPRQRQVRERDRRAADGARAARTATSSVAMRPPRRRGREGIGRACAWRGVVAPRRRARRAARAPTASGSAAMMQVDRRQPLMVHAPAVVQLVIERDVDDLGRAARRRTRSCSVPGEVDPVEAEDHVGRRDRRRAVRRRAGSPGAPTCSGWSVGNAAPTLRSVTTRAPRRSASATRASHARAIARDAPDQDQRPLAPREQRRRVARPRPRRRRRGGRRVARRGDRRRQRRASGASCMPASRLT